MSKITIVPTENGYQLKIFNPKEKTIFIDITNREYEQLKINFICASWQKQLDKKHFEKNQF